MSHRDEILLERLLEQLSKAPDEELLRKSMQLLNDPTPKNLSQALDHVLRTPEGKQPQSDHWWLGLLDLAVDLLPSLLTLF